MQSEKEKLSWKENYDLNENWNFILNLLSKFSFNIKYIKLV